MSLPARLEPREAPQLEVLRIGLGAALLVGFGGLAPDLAELYGDAGWVSREAFAAMSLDAGRPSVLTWVRGPAALAVLYAGLLAAALAFTLGLGVRWVKWPLWVLYVSLLNRNPAMVYGVDLLAAGLLLPVCVAPVGRWLALGRRDGRPPCGPRAAVCLALVRWQMALVFFFSAAQKLRGELWWSGEAVWIAVNNPELAHLPVAGWLARSFWLVTLATHGTLLVELAYPFLIWGRRTRPWALGAAIGLHLGIAALFGLYLFAWVAIAGHLAFVRRSWIQAATARVSSAREQPERSAGPGIAAAGLRRSDSRMATGHRARLQGP